MPYTRYFLAHILEFQFYRALCHESGYTGPLNRCTFYGSKEAGAKFNKMLAMGQSKPWPDALEALTGERQMDAGAMLEYFAPLQKWLDEQNKGHRSRLVVWTFRHLLRLTCGGFLRLELLASSRDGSIQHLKSIERLIVESSMSRHARYAVAILALSMVRSVVAQEVPASQPPLWSAKPDVAAFEKTENEHLAAAQRSIDAIAAVKGARTIENTLVPYDEAVRQINAAAYFASLMQQVHPDATFRDHATSDDTQGQRRADRACRSTGRISRRCRVSTSPHADPATTLLREAAAA